MSLRACYDSCLNMCREQQFKTIVSYAARGGVQGR